MTDCFSCEVFRKHERQKRLTKVFKWHIFAEDKPEVTGIEYIVLINGAELATCLTWNGSSFVDDEGTVYNVKYWAYMPEPPVEKGDK